ncbi:MAG TPA: helix-turn-helix domain-containing protein [Pyrinomonadaceae bacterium]|jgi:transposase
MRFIKLSETDLKSLQQGQRYGKHFLFRDRCQCLLLSHQGQTIPQLTGLFKVHRVTIYEWFNLWESGGIEALHKKPGQGRRPKLQITNQRHVTTVQKAVSEERQSLKQAAAKLANELKIEMHPDTLKRFLKNLSILSDVSANVSKPIKTRDSTTKAN